MDKLLSEQEKKMLENELVFFVFCFSQKNGQRLSRQYIGLSVQANG